MKKHFGLATAVVMCMSAGAIGAVSWGTPSGSADNFDWANGQNSDTNYFGDAFWFGGDILYFFSNFDVASPGGATSKSDTLDVDLAAKTGMKFTNVDIRLYGDYNITDPNSTGGNSVTADFDMTGTKAGHPMSPWTDGFVFTTNVPTPSVTGWNDSASLALLSIPDVTDLHLSVSGSTLVIDDGHGGTASLTANIQEMEMRFTLIPEPASLGLLALGGLAAFRRRR